MSGGGNAQRVNPRLRAGGREGHRRDLGGDADTQRMIDAVIATLRQSVG